MSHSVSPTLWWHIVEGFDINFKFLHILIILSVHEIALETCKFRDKFSEILKEMQKRK